MRDEDDFCSIMPRIGAFEVSVVLDPDGKAGDIRFYSKILAKCWPHNGDLTNRIVRCFEEYDAQKNQMANSLVPKYETTGKVIR